MRDSISLVPLSVGPDFVSYYVYYPDLYSPRRIIRNMVRLIHVGTPIFRHMTNLEVGVCGVTLANWDR